MQIRRATSEDTTAIINLIRLLAQDEGESSSISPEYVRTYQAYPDCHILLAEENGEIRGLLSYSARPDLYHAGISCLIEALVVSAASRGQGMGSALVQAVLEQGRAEHWAEISVSTMPDNRSAIAFYHKHGFTDEAVLLEQHNI